METIVGRCGYRCDLCPAYKDNIRGRQHRQWVSDGWFKFFGFRIPPDEISCDGCWAEDSTNPKRIDTDCPVRPCVIEKGLDSCAQCSEYVCDRLRERLVDGKKVLERAQGPVPQAERDAFVRPYDNVRRLDRMRRKLAGEETADEAR